MVNFLLGQQSGFTKYPCFLCMWDSSTDLRTIPRRTSLHEMKWCRVDPTALSTILLWTDTKYSFHRCTSSLAWFNSSPKPWTGMVATSLTCVMFFQDYPLRNWKVASLMVLKFVSSSEILSLTSQWPNQNRKHGKPLFWLWRTFWVTPKPVIMKNLSPTCLGCNMSIKMHYLFSHIDRSPENLGAMSDEQEERFHQDIKEMETRYQRRWDAAMMADYCWTMKRDIPSAEHSRMSKKRKLISWNLPNDNTTYLSLLF